MRKRGDLMKKGEKPKGKSISLQQKMFADEYMTNGGNAYQAAIAAGYSHNYAKSKSSGWVEKDGIKEYIEERMKELDSKKIAKQEEVLEFLTSVLRAEEDDEVLNNMGEVVKVKVSNRDRIKAAELFGKYYGTWSDKVDINMATPVVIEGAKDLED